MAECTTGLTFWRKIAPMLGVAGIILLVLNLIGLMMPLRSDVIGEDYADFARSTTLSYDDAMEQLRSLKNTNTSEFVEAATRIFHHGMAHIPPKDVESGGVDLYRMRVPVWENYLLYILSYLKPDTYRDYEFCAYPKALERGAGRCGQQSLALIGYLTEHGVDTGFVHLGGHTLATAKVAENKWFMLDPDYGGVIPFGIEQAQKQPDSVLPHYWNDAMQKRQAYLLFGPEGNYVKYGGPEVRWARACKIEVVAYTLKWLIPLMLIGLWGGLRKRSSNQKRGR